MDTPKIPANIAFGKVAQVEINTPEHFDDLSLRLLNETIERGQDEFVVPLDGVEDGIRNTPSGSWMFDLLEALKKEMDWHGAKLAQFRLVFPEVKPEPAARKAWYVAIEHGEVFIYGPNWDDCCMRVFVCPELAMSEDVTGKIEQAVKLLNSI